jgi:hypothetical protein
MRFAGARNGDRAKGIGVKDLKIRVRGWKIRVEG